MGTTVNEVERHLLTIFSTALDREPTGARAAYLDEACAGDPDLRDRVEALLRAHGQPGRFLEPDAADEDATLGRTSSSVADGTLSYDAPPEGLGAMIGPYRLVQVIGEGGMGTVYLAEQTAPVRRVVALKIIKPGMDTGQVVARFEAERQALAMMDHPSIAKVLDVGATATGRPFFVMELVKGVPITEYCDTVHLTPKERLELFIPVCAAVQHAHQKGIIHRDIKPSNVLVAMQDGKPVPKVIDFGIAKATEQRLTERSLFTQHGAIVGTLEYMSPEQAEMSALGVDTRTDVYALGVMLYELLTGTTPLERARLRESGYAEILKRIKEEEPPKPSTRLSESRDSLPSVAAQRRTEPSRLTKLVRGDLDWIVMKSIEKDRTRRYETANGLARDIRRYLDGDAVEACPPSASYKLSKFARKHRLALATVGAFALLLAAATAISAGLAFWADRERGRAVNAENSAKAQQTRAEDREQMAINAVKRFRDSVADEPELKNTPALEGLRKRLMKEPLTFFRALRDRLQADGDTRTESLARLADASYDLGNLTHEIGDKRDALIAFQEALAIRRKLADAQPDDTEFQDKLARSHISIGALMRETGEPAQALTSFETGLAIFRRLAEAHPNVTDFQSSVAGSLNNIGTLLSETGRPDDALAAYELALAIGRKLNDTHPDVTDYQSKLAMSHDNMGSLFSTTGKPTEAIAAYKSALAIRRKLVAAHPDDTGFQSNMAMSHFNIGILLRHTGKPVESLAAYESALAIRRKLVAANPTNTEFQSDLAGSHNNIGILLRDMGKPAESMKAFESMLSIQRALADANPSVTEFQSGLADSFVNIANVLYETGTPNEALKSYTKALAIRQKLSDANPSVTAYRGALATVHNNIGGMLSETGKPVDALASFKSALAIWRALADANPTITDFQIRVADVHFNIGNLMSGTEKPSEAMEAYRPALAILRTLVRDHPESSAYASRLGVTLTNIAKIDLNAKRFEEARVGVRQAIEWQGKALASYPSNPAYRDYQANNLECLIASARALGDPQDVAKAEHELAKLRDSDPAMVALDVRLSAIIKGIQRPVDDAERLQLAQRAFDKALHATSARLFAEALANDSTLADARRAQYRYNAACAAARAACGQGKDDPPPDDAAKARLRRQALDWLRAELKAWRPLTVTVEPGSKEAVSRTLQHWKVDPDLASLRDRDHLARLPEEEREAFRRLWADVDALLAQARNGPNADRPDHSLLLPASILGRFNYLEQPLPFTDNRPFPDPLPADRRMRINKFPPSRRSDFATCDHPLELVLLRSLKLPHRLLGQLIRASFLNIHGELSGLLFPRVSLQNM